MYADENYLLTLQEVANLTDNYSSEYTYELGGMAIEGNGSNGRKSFPRLKSRKDKGIVSNYGMSANEKVYEYDGAVGFTEYTMSETTVQTGAKTEYTSNVLRQITNKRSSLPDSDLTIETNYSYDKYRLLESYEQKTYNSSGSYSVTESYEHDEKGNLISHTDKFGTQRQYSYDDATSVIANIEEPISRYGYSSMRYTTNELDPNGSIIKTSIMDQIKNIAQTTEYTYDTYGNILSSKSLPAYMAEEIFEYTDDHANIKRLIKGDRVTAEYEYDNIGRKISETNALGQTTKYKYSFRGDLVEVINPDHTNTKNLYSSDLGSIYETNIYCDEKGPVKKETIDDFGRVTSVSEISVLESENTYNNQYNYEDFYEDESKFFDIFTLDGWQTKENIRYDSIGRVTEVSNVNGTTKYEYDGFNRIIKKINPDLSEQRIEYDDIERTRTVYDEEGNKTIEKYDAENRVISQTIFPNENTPVSNSFSYDREGQLAMIVDYNGNTTGYHYDTLGRKTETENALGERSYKKYASDMSYDAEYYFDGTVRQMNYYDEFGRLSAVTDEYFNVNTYAYDAGDNLIESIDKNGNSIRYKYNSRNAVTNISTNGAEKEYTYDEAGKTRAIESRRANSSGILDKENRIQYNYRRNGLVNDETDSRLDGTSRVTFNTQYNEIGFPTSFTVRKDTGQEIKKTKYTRDEMDRVSDIGQMASDVQNKNVGCEYYANGWLKKETLPNGYSNNYVYDGAGRMTELNRIDANGISALKYSYTYDNNGNRTGMVEIDKNGVQTVTQYEYDALNRLTKEVNGHSGNTTTYAFDAQNNIKEKKVSGAENYTESYIYTSENTDKYMSDRIIEVTRKTDDEILSRIYYYQEPNGNTYKKIVTNAYGEPTETTEYTYNSWNLLESAAVQKGNTKTDVTFKYDATNRRNGKITKIYENEKLKNSKTTEYIWYGDKVQYEEVTQNRAVTPSVNMWGMTGLAARNDDLFSSDAHGNTDAEYSGETTVKKYAYDAYGNAINDNGDDDNPYRYCGESYDEETGLYYLRARYYDPSIGRFMSEDPAQDGTNWYVYCGNNPVMRVDPSGKKYIIDSMAKWVWQQGAEHYLRNRKGWYLTATLLELSTNDSVQCFEAHDGDYSANLIKYNSDFRKQVNDYLWENGTRYDYSYAFFTFTYAFDVSGGDLGAALHNVFVAVTAERNSDASWNTFIQVYDTFDFTEFRNPLLEDDLKSMFLWTMNDLAFLDQAMNVIEPVEVYIDFYDTY